MMLKRGLFLFVSALPAVAFAAATLTMLTGPDTSVLIPGRGRDVPVLDRTG